MNISLYYIGELNVFLNVEMERMNEKCGSWAYDLSNTFPLSDRLRVYLAAGTDTISLLTNRIKTKEI